MRIETKVEAIGHSVGDDAAGEPRARRRRRPDALEPRPGEARPARSRDRDPPRHRRRDRRRVALRREAHVPGLEALLLHERVAAAVGARRRPRAVPQLHGAHGRRKPRRCSSATRSARPASRSTATSPCGRRRTRALPVAKTLSPPLASIVALHGSAQRQLHGRELLKLLALTRYERGARRPRGAKVVMRALKAAGIPTAGVRIVDGSGLSQDDRLTVGALVGDPPGVRHRPRARGRAAARAARRRRQRHAASTGCRTPPLLRHVTAKTGTTEHRLVALRLRQLAHRLRDHPERAPARRTGRPARRRTASRRC